MNSAPRPDTRTPDAMPEGQACRTVTAGEFAMAWPRATLVDVRSQEEHATAHVPGSLNIPWTNCPPGLPTCPAARFTSCAGQENAAARPHGSLPTADTKRSMWPAGSPSGTGQATPSPTNKPRTTRRGNNLATPRQACAVSCTSCSTERRPSRSPLAGYPRGYLYWIQNKPPNPFQLKEITRCLSSVFTMKTSPRPAT